jgi:hypothetical protein
MLQEIDRIQLAVEDVDQVSHRWQQLLGAEMVRNDHVDCLAAHRRTLAVGTSLVEILSASGAGVVAEALVRRGPHLFAAGVSTNDLSGLHRQVSQFTDRIVEENDQLHIDGADIGIPGLRVVASQHESRPAVGDLDYLYEATLLADDADGLTARFAEVFNLDAQSFVNIDSPRFGYNGTLTLFREHHLHRFEVITPIDSSATMGRFFSKVGPCLYMAFAETGKILDIEQRTAAANLGQTVDRPEQRSHDVQADQVWLHPATLGGHDAGIVPAFDGLVLVRQPGTRNGD